MHLALNNLQRLICQQTQKTNNQSNLAKSCLRRWSRRYFVLENTTFNSLKIFQARQRRKFTFNTFQNRCKIFKLVKNFEVHGICEECRANG